MAGLRRRPPRGRAQGRHEAHPPARRPAGSTIRCASGTPRRSGGPREPHRHRHPPATTAIVAAVALFAAGDSYTHIYDLARHHGQSVVSAALLPLAGDGLIAAASAAMLAAARDGKPVPARARVLLLAGIAATIAANVAYGLPDGITGALLSVWPVACYVGCMELLTWMRENLSASARPAAASARTPKPDAPEVPRPDAPEVPRAGDLITIAVARFPEAAKGGRIPSLRVIQGELGVGQGKAQQVQRHFLSLQAATG